MPIAGEADTGDADGVAIGIGKLAAADGLTVEGGRLGGAAESGGARKIAAAMSPSVATAPATTPAISHFTRACSRRSNYYTARGMNEYMEQPPADPIEGSEGPLEAGAEPPARRGSRRVIGPFTIRHLLVANTVIAIFLVVLFAVTQPLGASNPTSQTDPGATFYRISAETQGLEIGQRAPDLVGTGDNGQQIRLMDLDGHPLSMADLKGHPVWINFWATWCPPCQRETPVLRAAYEAHRADGLILIGIDVQEEASGVRDYVTKYGLTYTVGVDVTGAIFRTYRAFGLPTHYFIDRNGIIRDRVFGPVDQAGVEKKLAEILGP